MKLILIISLICFFALTFTPWWILWVFLGVCGVFATTPKEALNIGVKVATLTWGIKIGIKYFCWHQFFNKFFGQVVLFSCSVLQT